MYIISTLGYVTLILSRVSRYRLVEYLWRNVLEMKTSTKVYKKKISFIRINYKQSNIKKYQIHGKENVEKNSPPSL